MCSFLFSLFSENNIKDILSNAVKELTICVFKYCMFSYHKVAQYIYILINKYTSYMLYLICFICLTLDKLEANKLDP